MATNKKIIDGREYLLLPIDVLGTAGEVIKNTFYLGKRHMEYIKVQEYVPLWIKRDVHYVKGKDGKDVACYAVSPQEYKIFKSLYDDALIPF